MKCSCRSALKTNYDHMKTRPNVVLTDLGNHLLALPIAKRELEGPSPAEKPKENLADIEMYLMLRPHERFSPCSMREVRTELSAIVKVKGVAIYRPGEDTPAGAESPFFKSKVDNLNPIRVSKHPTQCD
jgi:hypothetical protein